jgi:hypothetical protein
MPHVDTIGAKHVYICFETAKRGNCEAGMQKSHWIRKIQIKIKKNQKEEN